MHSLATPLFKMAEISDKNFSVSLFCLFLVFRLPQISMIIVSIAVYGDHNDALNDVGWSTMQAIKTLIHSFEAACLLLIVVIVGRKMSHFVQILIDLTPTNPNHGQQSFILKK